MIKINHQELTPNMVATLPASILSFGKLLKMAIPSHKNPVAKKGDQSAIFPVFAINPQVAKEMTTQIHQGKIKCNKKEMIKITRKTILIFLIIASEK